MKLYYVQVSDCYNASYEGEINTSYSELVFANSEEGAIEFINEDLKQFSDTNAIAKTAKEINSNKGNFLRKTQRYK